MAPEAKKCLWVLGKEGRGQLKVRGRRDMIMRDMAGKGAKMSTRRHPENPTVKDMGPFQLMMSLMKGSAEYSQLSKFVSSFVQQIFIV